MIQSNRSWVCFGERSWDNSVLSQSYWFLVQCQSYWTSNSHFTQSLTQDSSWYISTPTISFRQETIPEIFLETFLLDSIKYQCHNTELWWSVWEHYQRFWCKHLHYAWFSWDFVSHRLIPCYFDDAVTRPTNWLSIAWWECIRKYHWLYPFSGTIFNNFLSEMLLCGWS